MTFVSAGRFGAEAIISSSGVPVTSTPVTVYLTGTTTVAALYTDQTEGTAAANPTSTDGLGNLTFYAQPGVYDLAFTVGGVATTQTVEVQPWWNDLSDVSTLVTQMSELVAGNLPAYWTDQACDGTPPGGDTLSPGVKILPGFIPSATTNAAGGFTHNFPIAFPNGLYGVMTQSMQDSAGNYYDCGLIQSQCTTTGFGGIITKNGASWNSAAFNLFYVAFGW